VPSLCSISRTFLNDTSAFREVKPKGLEEIHNLQELGEYLQGVTLDSLLKELGANGIKQNALAESMGMNPRHLSSIKSSELRNRYHNELGATKLACLWMLEHLCKGTSE